MNASADPVVESDLVAYVDDALGAVRRIEVEAHLAGHPALAARVMADLRNRDELRLALAGSSPSGQPRTAEAARRLERALRRRKLTLALRRAAAVALVAGIGWFAHAEFGPLGVRESVASAPPPAFVRDAFMAHRTSQVRAGMTSQPEAGAYDRAEILAATAIAVPALPKGWTARDVQVFPSPFGPSVEMALDAARLGSVSLFAARPGSFDVIRTRLAEDGAETAAYWQVGDVAYALVARAGDADRLEAAAAALAASLY